MPYLIDGHNLISHLPTISLDDPHDEAKLVLRLRGFAARRRKKVFVIFDEGLPGGESHMSTFSVKVVFASSSRTNADNVMRERIREIPDPSNWTVVSSDNEVLDAARERGMRPLPCLEFAKQLRRPQKKRPERGSEVHVSVPSSEIEAWMSAFDSEADGMPPVEPLRLRRRRTAEAEPPDEQDESAATKDVTPSPASPEPRVQPEMSDAVDPGLTRNDVDSWMALFGEADDDMPPLDKPRRQSMNPGQVNGSDDVPAPRVRKERHRKQNRAPADPDLVKNGDDYLTDEDVEMWMRLFGDQDQ